MKSVFFGYIVASYVASAASDCWSPAMPGPASCSVCTKDELKGSQCVRSGRWFGCYASAELCCKDGEVLNYTSQEDCIKNAMKGQGDDDDDSDDEDDNSKIDQDECQKVVARSPVTTNRQCMKECSDLVKQGKKPSDDTQWSKQCMTAHWHGDNGRTVVDGQCFEKWVYGYSEPNNLASYKLNLSAETPALCQALCQDDDECVNWLWVSPLYAPGTEVAKRCMLKTQKMVDKPLGMSTEQQPPKNLDVNYCNYQMGWSCQNLYKCLPCEGERRCVWESDMHISGWKYCNHTDSCSAESPLFPSVEPSTQLPPKMTDTAVVTPTIAKTQSPPRGTDTVAPAPTQAPSTAPATTKSSSPATTPNAAPTPQAPTPQASTPQAPTPSVAGQTTPGKESPKTEKPGDEVPGLPNKTPEITAAPQASTSGSAGKETPAASSAPAPATPVTPEAPQPDKSAPQDSSDAAQTPLVPSTATPALQPTLGPSVPPEATQTRGPAGGNDDELVTPAPAATNPQPSDAPAEHPTPSPVDPTVPKPADDCPSLPTQTGIVLDPSTTPSSGKASLPGKCPPTGCVGGCSCCGMRECGCCQQSGIVLRISERPKHLKFEVSN